MTRALTFSNDLSIMRIIISYSPSRPQVSFTKSAMGTSHNLPTSTPHPMSPALLNGPAALRVCCEVITTVIPPLLAPLKLTAVRRLAGPSGDVLNIE